MKHKLVLPNQNPFVRGQLYDNGGRSLLAGDGGLRECTSLLEALVSLYTVYTIHAYYKLVHHTYALHVHYIPCIYGCCSVCSFV